MHIFRRAYDVEYLSGCKVVYVAVDALATNHCVIYAGYLSLHQPAEIGATENVVHYVLGC